MRSPRAKADGAAAPTRAADQLGLPLGKPTSASEVQAIAVGRRVVMVRLVRHPRSRRYVLRVLPDGTVRVTLPARGTRAAAFAFLRRELPWVDRQRYAVARHAGTVLFRGVALPLDSRVDGEIAPERRLIRFGDETVVARRGETARAAVCRRMREIATQELKVRLAALAARFRIVVRRVTIRAQHTRWGSCSPSGAIALNWRLVQMPDSVRDYILVHELMHVRERNHSRRFWALVEGVCPGHQAARRWLKAHEGELN
jgi:predicted metal-dependent hydrolase